MFLVRDALSRAWAATVIQYHGGAINSERTLQAVLFGELRRALPEFRVLCEPTITLSAQTVVPDIVVVGGRRSIVVALELKFVPHQYPVFETDIGKLRQYGAFADPFPLTIDPATGRFDGNSYTFDPECLLVFAAVGQHDAKATDVSILNREAGIGERFIPLICSVGGVTPNKALNPTGAGAPAG